MGVLGVSDTAGDIVGEGEGLHVGALVLDHVQLVLGSTCPVVVAELDDRLVSGEASGVADTAGDIVSVLLHVGPDGGLHVGVLVLDHLQVVLGGAQPVGVAIGDRQVSVEALPKHTEVGDLVHLERIVPLEPCWVVDHLVCLEGGHGHCWTEGVVVHGAGHVLGAGLLVQLGGFLISI